MAAPPGSALLQLTGRLASFLSFLESPAARINEFMALVTALSATLLYFTIRRVLRLLAGDSVAPSSVISVASALAASTLAFSQSVWSHATFTNPYALSMLTAVALLYLAVRWWEDADSAHAVNWLLLVAFVLGLDLSVHRSNLMLLPGFALMVLIRRPRSLASARPWIGGAVFFVLGVSMQLFNLFRAQLGPEINMGDPDTLSGLVDYLSLRQTGVNVFGTDLFQRKGPFWDWQIKHEYLRYLGWNFIGMDSAGVRVALSGLFGLPLLAGIAGTIYHFIRRWKHAVFVAGFFLSASFLAIVYLNVPENYFRTMDRHFLASFVVFTVWIGIGCFTLLRWLGSLARVHRWALWTAVGVLILALPVHSLVSGWALNDQSDNYTAYDYGRNMLDACEPNALLITSGDNDTFPLWYLQMVEGYRTDVMVLNMSLLNATWHLHSLMDYHPDLGLTLNRDSLDYMSPKPIEIDTVSVSVAGPDSLVVDLIVAPTLKDKYQMVADQVLLNLLEVNRWRRPVYASLGLGGRLPFGLARYSRMDGMVERVVPDPGQRINLSILEENLLNRYQYRGLGTGRHLDRTAVTMQVNYQMAFARLQMALGQEGAEDRIAAVEARFSEIWPASGGLEAWMEAQMRRRRPGS